MEYEILRFSQQVISSTDRQTFYLPRSFREVFGIRYNYYLHNIKKFDYKKKFASAIIEQHTSDLYYNIFDVGENVCRQILQFKDRDGNDRFRYRIVQYNYHIRNLPNSWIEIFLEKNILNRGHILMIYWTKEKINNEKLIDQYYKAKKGRSRYITCYDEGIELLVKMLDEDFCIRIIKDQFNIKSYSIVDSFIKYATLCGKNKILNYLKN
jgi:hypothetical protein